MKISIITVCFNSEETIRSTIESVQSQNYSDVEYIIVDGRSTDSTMSLIEEYGSEISGVICEADEGLYDAMNKGIEASSGDVVGILNSDDVFIDEFVLSEVVACFEENRESDIVFGDVVYARPNKPGELVRYYSSRHFQSWKLRFGWMPPHPATFIRSDVYESVGKYSLEYKISADYDFFIRAFMIHKYRFSRIDRALVKMTLGGISSSGLSSNIKLNLEIVDACRNNGVYTNIFMVLSKIPFKLLELYRRRRSI